MAIARIIDYSPIIYPMGYSGSNGVGEVATREVSGAAKRFAARAARSRTPVAVCTRPKSSRPCQPTGAAHAAASPVMRYAISVMLQQPFDDVVATVRGTLVEQSTPPFW
jgi:hypothetical protein